MILFVIISFVAKWLLEIRTLIFMISLRNLQFNTIPFYVLLFIFDGLMLYLLFPYNVYLKVFFIIFNCVIMIININTTNNILEKEYAIYYFKCLKLDDQRKKPVTSWDSIENSCFWMDFLIRFNYFEYKKIINKYINY